MADKVWMESANLNEVLNWLSRSGEFVEEQIRKALPTVAYMAAAEIAARAPTPDQEYALIMSSDIGRSGDHSADPDGRIRFEREPGQWIKEAIMEPSNIRVNLGTLEINLGDALALTLASVFSYTNYSKKQGSHTYSSDFSGQLFRLLEYGGSYTVNAIHAERLAPDADKTHRTKSMTKSFPGFRMYSSFDPTVFYDALVELAGLDKL